MKNLRDDLHRCSDCQRDTTDPKFCAICDAILCRPCWWPAHNPCAHAKALCKALLGGGR